MLKSAQTTVANKIIERDEEGFLLYTEDWSEELAHQLACEEGMELQGERLEIVRYVRDYFETRESVPEARTLLKHMKQIWGEERATRKYLYRLFPRGYGQQACKIAGMRKPRKLMLDV
ncbi:MAG: TusE/DsrC/DsvC family sulfur relay protein [Gammaproteobacteria bacterium]|jgi:tRNA 2-thiouridine synthesizing protein E|nr:TusE/DsrC/DsvC family sulfur relay protein [Gammaproteobacteria bacterium]